MLWPIILFLFLFTIIALVHEGGHYFAAKRAGIHVHEFGIGFGPRIFSYNKNGTDFSINLIPVLAFVSLAGMDEPKEQDYEIPKNEQYFATPPLSKFLLSFAGPFMNIFLAFIVLCLSFSIFGMPSSISNVIDRIQPNSVAEKAGLKPYDKIIGFNGKNVENMELVIKSIHESGGKPLTLKIDRNGNKFSITALPQYNKKLKVFLLGFTPKPIYRHVNVFEGVLLGAQQTWGMIILMFVVIGQLISGAVSLNDLAGPIGIAHVTGRYADSGFVSLLNFFAFLNVNIGVLNLLPLPALDGGHIVFSLIEAITRRPVNEDVQKKVHRWGLIFLLGLMILVTLNDLLRIFRPQ